MTTIAILTIMTIIPIKYVNYYVKWVIIQVILSNQEVIQCQTNNHWWLFLIFWLHVALDVHICQFVLFFDYKLCKMKGIVCDLFVFKWLLSSMKIKSHWLFFDVYSSVFFDWQYYICFNTVLSLVCVKFNLAMQLLVVKIIVFKMVVVKNIMFDNYYNIRQNSY